MNKYLSRFLLGTLALILLLAGFLGVIATTSVGQRFVTWQVNNYLAKKLKSPFHIGRIRYRIPNWVELDDVYFETPKGDTLLSGQRLRVDLDMLGLLQSRIVLNEVRLERVRVNLTRTLPDTTFNFKFLLDAFSTNKTPKLIDTTAAPLEINLSVVALKDVRVRYLDDVAGADVDVFVDTLHARIDRINPTRSQYYLTEAFVEGLQTRTRLYPGVEQAQNPDATADTLDLRLGRWRVNRAKWDVRVEEEGFQTQGVIGQLAVNTDYFYLNGQQLGIKALELSNSDIVAVLEKKKPAKPVDKSSTPTTESKGWQAKITQLTLVNNRIRFDNQNALVQRSGMDYAHLDVRNLGLSAQAVSYQPERITGQFRQGRFQEKSGFVLQRLDADVLYSANQILLNQLLILTPRTVIRDQLVLQFDSLGQLSRPAAAARVKVGLNLRQSTLAVADVLQLAPFLAQMPPFAGNREGVIRVNGRATGTLADLNIPNFELSMLSGTRIRARGRVRNATDVERLNLDLVIQDAATTSADLRRLVPPGTLPDSISLAPTIRLSGRVRGRLNDLNLQSQVTTDWGNAAFDGTLKGFLAGKNQAYAGTATLTNFNAGRWLQQPQQLGKITAKATFNGRGLDLKTMQTTFDLVVNQAQLNGYNYQNLDVNGALTQGVLMLRGTLDDPNAQLAIDTQVGLLKGGTVQTYPSVVGNITLQSLDLQKLKLYKDPLEIRGRISLDMTSTDPAQPEGTVIAQEATVLFRGKSYPIDSMYLNAGTAQEQKTIRASVPFGQVSVRGNYAYTRLYDLVAGELNRYFNLPDLDYKPVAPPYNATIQLKAFAHPLLAAFVPALTRLDTVRLTAYVDNRLDTTFRANLTTGVIEYDTLTVENASLAMLGANNQLAIKGQVSAVRNESLKIGLTQLTGTAAANQFRFSVVTKDSLEKDRHGLAGLLSLDGKNYRLRLAQNGLLTNYRRWTSDTTGFVQYGKAGVLAERFLIQSQNQRLTLNSVAPIPNAPLRVQMQDFNLSDLARIANQDTAMVGGILNGDVVVRDYLGSNNALSFTGDLKVDSLEFTGKPLGTLTAQFANASDQRISVKTALSGPNNELTVVGFYNPKSAGEALDFRINLERLDARTIEAFSFGQLRQAKGRVNGAVAVTGAVDQPRFQGRLAFDSVAFNVAQVNATYHIDQEQLTFNGSTITLDQFDLRDTLGRKLTTDGTVTLGKLPDVSYALQMNTSKFMVLNAARKDNNYAYGNAAVTASLRIQGSGGKPSITGNMRLDEGSNIFLVLPDQGPNANEARKVVTFINHKDTLVLRKYLLQPRRDTLLPRLAFQQLNASQVSLNVEVDEKSELTLIIDELNGDQLRARGNARLNVSLNASGEVSVLGRYDVTDGEYSLTYQILRRRFKLQKGGYIQFTGDPLRADLNLTAIYSTNAAPADLVASESSSPQASGAFRAKIPFDVLLSMSGNLASPQLTFNIVVPDRSFVAGGGVVEAVNAKLIQLRQDPSQMNKQVFALLVLNGFIAENTSNFFSGSGGGGTGLAAENLARGSVSKILSQQLEKFVSGILGGVDVNLDLQSTNDYAAVDVGQEARRGGRTDLNVGLSKSFLNGRLSVTVGKNFVLENSTGLSNNPTELFDNVSLNYNLSPDGRYVVRVYRQNLFNSQTISVVQGYVIETGVAFVITMDYNLLRELFQKNEQAGRGGSF
ncbi:MAG: translocation/assembly module TamB domain-containing protein [Cytophagaceae bacterium]|nr:translocation/assembly module TamB domain-containing protein [Cytophagaceae bacterium]